MRFACVVKFRGRLGTRERLSKEGVRMRASGILGIRLRLRVGIAALTVTLGLAMSPAAYADTFYVNSDLDLDGTCSVELCTLRQAINSANANPGRDRVLFSIAPAGPHSIRVLTALPVVTESAVFNAMTQPGYAGRPLIELDGSLLTSGNGFTLDAGSDVRGFVINRFRAGAGVSVSPIDYFGSMSSTIADDYIGTDATGTFAAGNRIGVELLGSSNNVGKLNAYLPDDPPAGPNVISGNTGAGVFVGGVSRGNAIAGNFIGTNATGDAAVGNGTGIEIQNGGATFIGGNTGSGGARNVISGNGVGVHIDAFGGTDSSATFYNNYIGTDVTGTRALGNDGPAIWGVDLWSIDVGFPDDAYTNVISGNGADAIRLEGVQQGSIYDNRIGTDRTGTRPLGNGGAGIALLNGTTGIVIGGQYGNVPNVISANDLGVKIDNSSDNVVGGSLIGTDATGQQPLGNRRGGVEVSGNRNTIGNTNPVTGGYYSPNTIAFNGGPGVAVLTGVGNPILGNSIFANAGLGIDLAPAGVTPNDPGDLDTGANDLQNYPLLQRAVVRPRSGTTVTGTLFSHPNTTYTIELFANLACDPSQFGEGRRYVVTTQVTTNGQGVASFSIDVGGIGGGEVITSTATDPGGSTSEFSNCVTARGAPA
jgi:hypothetical protein